jgi:cell wall-associated NlpC family hydrolase
MVQSVYALHGVSLPRDAWQQAGEGRDAGTDLDAHAPGDLLFFSDRDDGRITHVGVAAGAGTMCHLALGRGGWAVDDLTDAGDAYAARLRAQLVGARRVFG